MIDTCLSEYQSFIEDAECLFNSYYKISHGTQLTIEGFLQKETVGTGYYIKPDTNSLHYKLFSNYTNSNISDEEVYYYRLNNFENKIDSKYEALTFIQYLIHNKKEDESLHDILQKALIELNDYVGVSKKPEIFIDIIYLLLQLEYYCYNLDIICDRFINKQKELSVKDALSYSIITNIKLTQGLYTYTTEGYNTIECQFLHLTCLLGILQDKIDYRIFKDFKETVKLIPQPLVFDKFKLVPINNFSLQVDEKVYMSELSEVFYYSKREIVISQEPFIYSTIEDTIGMHNIWYFNIAPNISSAFNLKLTRNLLPILNAITTGNTLNQDQEVIDYMNQMKSIENNCCVFVLAALKSIENNIDFIICDDITIKAFILLECCRLMTSDIYNFYYKLYNYRYNEEFFNLEGILKSILEVDLESISDTYFALTLKEELTTHETEKYFYTSHFVGKSSPALSVECMIKEYWLLGASKDKQYYISLLDNEWGYEYIQSTVEKVILEIIWDMYKEDQLNIKDYSNAYRDYICNNDLYIELDTNEDSFYIKLLTLYLISGPVPHYKDNIEIQNRYMEMSLGL